jgi:hypothetical protein
MTLGEPGLKNFGGSPFLGALVGIGVEQGVDRHRNGADQGGLESLLMNALEARGGFDEARQAMQRAFEQGRGFLQFTVSEMDCGCRFVEVDR